MIKLIDVQTLKQFISKGFEINNKKIFAIFKEGGYFVYENKCPHLGIDLEFLPDQFLDSDKALIICSTHGALFEIQTGQCVSGPCLGEHLELIDSKVEQDYLWVSI
ncbi:MAG: Rieske 2Fe-2S domain-containing protein [Saccharospirillaceae bacterium]|nr:Rieske 2Fe-2S domain-containing protein [Pseudomonadales bacterium]NRB78611.1 Rieske 2Fe-2S domain-containing protein [Saccharospirillaceae bacterium]